MISTDQPTIFGREVIAAVSSKQNGNLKFGIASDSETLENRKRFLKEVGIDIAHTSLVGITYATDDFAKYRIATVQDKTIGMLEANMTHYVDAMVVTQPNHALFLPLADCVGAVLYDPNNKVLMVSHLGRHSVEQNGAEKSVQYLVDNFGVHPAGLLVWLSPAVGKATYPLHAFDGKSLHEVITKQLQQSGVAAENIETSQVNTANNENYYSHSEFLKGGQLEKGRFAIVAMMVEQGEPAV
jgi:copper oxidase (laccase) domain-containing protein